MSINKVSFGQSVVSVPPQKTENKKTKGLITGTIVAGALGTGVTTAVLYNQARMMGAQKIFPETLKVLMKQPGFYKLGAIFAGVYLGYRALKAAFSNN